MKMNIGGLVLGVIILFFGLVVIPIYGIGIIQWRTDSYIIQNAGRNLLDMVIDNGYVTDKAITDINLDLAGCYGTYTYRYYREEKVTEPKLDDMGNEIGGESTTTWLQVQVTDDTIWRTGDICTVVIEQQGSNLFQRIAMSFLGGSFNNIEIRVAGMVR